MIKLFQDPQVKHRCKTGSRDHAKFGNKMKMDRWHKLEHAKNMEQSMLTVFELDQVIISG